MVSKQFDFKQFTPSDVPLSQKEFLRSPQCPLLIDGDKCQQCAKKEVKLRAELKQKRKALGITCTAKRTLVVCVTNKACIHSTFSKGRE